MRDRLGLALAGAVFGLAVGGLLTAAIGVVLGALSASARELPAIVAVSALVSVALFAAFEQSLDLNTFGAYVASRPLANAAARIGVLAALLAIADGWRSIRGRREVDDAAPLVAQDHVVVPQRPGVTLAIGATAALLVLATVGDQSWRWTTIPLAAAALIVVLVWRLLSRWRGPTASLADSAPGQAVAWASRSGGNTIMSGSVWMLGAAGAVSIGSFVFWLAAARLSDQASVGAAAALFSVVTFLNYATAVGLPVALSRFGRADGVRSSVLFTWCLVLTASTSIIGVGLFAVVAPGSVQSVLSSSPALGWSMLLANTIGMSVSVLVDVRYMTLGLWRLVFWRSVAISLIRLPFIFFVEDAGALYLFVLISGAYTVTGLVWLAGLLVTNRSQLGLRPLPSDSIDVARYALVNYVAQLALQAPFFAIPVIVLTTQSTEDNASFYVAWGILTVVVMSVQVVGQVLLVEGRGTAHGQASVALAVGSAVTLTALVFVAVFGGLIRALYGSGYEEVSDLLVLLVAGTVPYTWTVIELSVARVRGDTRATALVSSLFSVLILVPALFFTSGNGSQGAAWAWLLGNIAAAVSIRILRRLGWAVRGRTSNDGDISGGAAAGEPSGATKIERQAPGGHS